MINTSTLENLHNSLSGDVLFDNLHKTLYATDASVYVLDGADCVMLSGELGLGLGLGLGEGGRGRAPTR